MRPAALRLTCLFAASLAALSAAAASSRPDKRSFPVKVHVVASRVQFYDGHFHQVLYAYVDGQYEELSAFVNAYAVLQPGDYPARLELRDKHSNDHDLEQTYVVQFPDGTTRNYDVSGMGLPPGTANPPAPNP